MPGTNTLIAFLLLAWFLPAFFFTHKHFVNTPKDQRKGFKKTMYFWRDQLSFIFWPIILVVGGSLGLILKVFRKKGAKK